MVGVPHSKGCLVCIRRKIKCDESRPQCERCLKKRISCPGYTRDRKFYLYAKPHTKEIESKSTTGTDQQQPSKYIGTLTDVVVAPSLASKTIAQQYREGFCDFLDVNFPGQFYGYSTRVGTNWFDVVRNSQIPTGKAFDLSLRSIGAMYISRKQGNSQLSLASLEMYGQALNQLAGILHNPDLAAADDTLGAAIILGGYELSCSAPLKFWMLHSRGISALYQLRGAKAHTKGLGRTLLSSFRGFLVHDAFTRGERCFLEDEEWKAIIPEIINEERERGKYSLLGELIEYSFHEIARCPGFLVATRNLIASPYSTDLEREQLMTSISGCEKALGEYRLAGITGINATQRPDDLEARYFFGPIPHHIRDKIARFSLQGMDSAIALLKQLIVLLKSDGSRRKALVHSKKHQEHNPWGDRMDPLIFEIDEGDYSNEIPSNTNEEESQITWLDRVSMTMGMVTRT